MSQKIRELEGTWEEILQHSEELTGHHVKLTIYENEHDENRAKLRPENQRMLEWLDELKNNPLTEEETKALDEFDQFRKEHPIRFRIPKDEP